RVASREPPDREPAPPAGTEPLDGFSRVNRTTRSIPAGGGQARRDCGLIEPDHEEQEPFSPTLSDHASNSFFNSSKLAVYASRLALTRRSIGIPLSRKRGRTTRRTISRSRRFSRLRSTIRLRCRGTTIPARG